MNRRFAFSLLFAASIMAGIFITVVVMVSTSSISVADASNAGPDLEAAISIWCDNFGREWELTGVKEGAKRIMTGARDINNELGCGPFPVFGSLVVTKGTFVLSVTAFDNPDSDCVSTGWVGEWHDGAFVGTVWNEIGPSGTFTLTPCTSSSPETGGGDPAVPE